MELVKNSDTSGLNLAKGHLLRGFPVIPVPYGQKNPIVKWKTLKVTTNNVADYFSYQPSNFAVALGRQGSNLADTDLDSSDAVKFSKVFGLKTGCVYGHEARPGSHRLYRLLEGEPKPMTFKSPDGDMILEIRGKNQLSILPGSKHPDGDMYVFESDLPPAVISYDALKHSAVLIAVAVLCSRCWPKKGSRNAAALALAGLFHKAGLTVDEARQIVWHVAKAQGDEEADNRAQTVLDTWKRADSGQPVTGASALCDLFGEKNVACLKEWLGASGSVDDDQILEFNKEYAVIGVGNKCKILHEFIIPGSLQKAFRLIDRNDFYALHANKRMMVDGKEVEIARLWFKHPLRRQYNGLVFRPRQQVPADVYNMWQGFNVHPLVGGNCEKILEHIAPTRDK